MHESAAPGHDAATRRREAADGPGYLRYPMPAFARNNAARRAMAARASSDGSLDR